MDELERVIEEWNLSEHKGCEQCGVCGDGIKTLTKAIRDAGYHKDPEKFCYAPMQQQNPPPKRKRIENEN